MQKDIKKIGLLSCHEDPNYGSMLQAYALAEAIKRLDKDVEYISYTIDPVPDSLDTYLKRVVKTVLAGIGLYHEEKVWDFFNTPEFSELNASFRRFHERYIPCSSKIYYADRIKKDFNPKDYANYIVGSDQSWSPHLFHSKKPYFLDFAEIERKQSYAPSLGTTVLSDEYKKTLKSKLSSFENISCREKENAEMLTRLLGRKVQYVLDPTLLLGQQDWDTIATVPKVNGGYVLAYILGEKDSISDFAERLGSQKGLPVYYVLTRPKYLGKNNLVADAGPDDFIGLVKNAEYIVTDSYHGCLFSINYNRNFYAFSKKDGDVNSLDNIRIVEFLRVLGLQDRFQSLDNASLLPDIDFSNANATIEQLREESWSYLKKIVE